MCGVAAAWSSCCCCGLRPEKAESKKCCSVKKCLKKVQDNIIEKGKTVLKKLPWLLHIFKMCYLFNVIYLITEYFITIGVRFKFGSTHDLTILFGIFLLFGALVVLMDLGILLIQFLHTNFNKSLVIAMFLFHLVVLMPWEVAGVITALKLDPQYMHSPVIEKYRQAIFHKRNLGLNTEKLWQEGAYSNCTYPDNVQMNDCAMRRLQDFGFCCGIFEPEKSHQTVYFGNMSKINICPYQIVRNSTNQENKTLEIVFPTSLCGDGLKSRYIIMLWLAYGGLMGYSLLVFLLTPFLYATFELDRRDMRRQFVSNWIIQNRLKLERQRAESRRKLFPIDWKPSHDTEAGKQQQMESPSLHTALTPSTTRQPLASDASDPIAKKNCGENILGSQDVGEDQNVKRLTDNERSGSCEINPFPSNDVLISNNQILKKSLNESAERSSSGSDAIGDSINLKYVRYPSFI